MRLLIITQKVDMDDDVLGFFHTWIKVFARNVESVRVICLEEGRHDLPKNVTVYSLGKEWGLPRVGYVLCFYKYILSQRHQYDAVFVHMNPEYVVLGGIFWKILHKRIGLWYTHRKVNLKLRVAEMFADTIFTASRESFGLPSKKVKILGHGIDIGAYTCPPYEGGKSTLNLLQVGRISPIKHCKEAVEAMAILKKEWPKQCRLRFAGGPNTKADEIYFEELKRLVVDLGLSDRIEFAGSVANKDILKEYCNADATLNLAPTGGLDKVVLESMASGRVAFSSNQTFADYFKPYTQTLLLKDNSPRSIADSVRLVFDGGDATIISNTLKTTAHQRASLENLIKSIILILT